MPDWLGYEGRRMQPTKYGQMLPFEKAREWVHTLGLKSQKEWQEWSKSGERPTNIPSDPGRTYRDAGWVSWPDWRRYDSWRGDGRAAARPKRPTARGRKRKRVRVQRPAALPPAGEEAQPAAASEEVAEEEECSICFDSVAEDARAKLRCSHSFCAPCLKEVAKKAAAEDGDGGQRASRLGVLIACPLCRARVRVQI